MIKALIFDFDGTILDTETPEFEAYQAVFAHYGAELRLEDWLPLVGTSNDAFDIWGEVARQTGKPVDRESAERMARSEAQRLVQTRTPQPGVLECIRAARDSGLDLAVASSSGRSWVEGHLDRLGLRDAFRLTCCADDVTRVKPAPDLYQCALAGLDLPASAALAIEDSMHGVHAAVAAGIFTIAIPNPITRSMDFSRAQLQIDSLAAPPLPELLEHARKLRAQPRS